MNVIVMRGEPKLYLTNGNGWSPSPWRARTWTSKGQCARYASFVIGLTKMPDALNIHMEEEVEMYSKATLPKGIRNNNPGNLRRGIIPEVPSKVIDGYAVFRNPEDGLYELARLLLGYYHSPGMRTVWDFISRYAPPSENDTAHYAAIVTSWMHLPVGSEKTRDVALNNAWHLLDMMRAIIHVECGPVPEKLSIGGEWFSAPELWAAIERADGL